MPIDIPMPLASKIWKKLNSLKTEKEKQKKIKEQKKNTLEIIEKLKAEERERKIKESTLWLKNFWESEIFKQVFNKLSHYFYFEIPNGENGKLMFKILGKIGCVLFYVYNKNNSVLFNIELGNMNSDQEIRIHMLSEESLNNFYLCIKNGIIWEHVEKSLIKSGFFEIRQ